MVSNPLKMIRLYALGLLTMLFSAGLVLLLRSVVSRLKLPDVILSEMTLLPGLAFHPNTALRRSVAARGYATLGEFRQWYDKQCEILDTRAADFDSAINALKRPTRLADYDQYPPGARAFLES